MWNLRWVKTQVVNETWLKFKAESQSHFQSIVPYWGSLWCKCPWCQLILEFARSSLLIKPWGIYDAKLGSEDEFQVYHHLTYGFWTPSEFLASSHIYRHVKGFNGETKHLWRPLRPFPVLFLETRLIVVWRSFAVLWTANIARVWLKARSFVNLPLLIKFSISRLAV